MGYIKITSFDENGISEKMLHELTADERLSLELDVDLATATNEKIKMLCWVCYKEIEIGNACDLHKGEK